MIVPEIDLPGHTHAAILAYPEIGPDDQVREPYLGVEVGFSSVDLTSDASWSLRAQSSSTGRPISMPRT